MIPRYDFDLSAEIPANATFWMPAEDEIPDDEGIGFFRDVWIILGWSREEVIPLLEDERRLVQLVDQTSDDPETFEALASAIERGERANIPEGVACDDSGKSLVESLDENFPLVEGFSPLEDLELGVAGLAHALCSIGAVPVASCRAHVGNYSWAHLPVVFTAIDEPGARWLKPLVAQADCGFGVDLDRPDFLAIHGNSILDLMRLAGLIIEHHATAPEIRMRPSKSEEESNDSEEESNAVDEPPVHPDQQSLW